MKSASRSSSKDHTFHFEPPEIGDIRSNTEVSRLRPPFSTRKFRNAVGTSIWGQIFRMAQMLKEARQSFKKSREAKRHRVENQDEYQPPGKEIRQSAYTFESALTSRSTC